MAEVSMVRYRGDNPAALLDALLQVVQYARDSSDDFRFGPLRLQALIRDGLQIHGPDLAGVMAILATIPGLAHVDA